MQEVKITKAILNERKELQVNLLVKEWDYKETEAQLLRQSKINWDLLDISFTWLKQWNQDQERKSKLNQLALTMTTYSDKFWVKLEDLVNGLYKKYNIKSRKELTDSALDSEIESYKSSIMSWLA